MSAIIKDRYFKTYEELKKHYFELFWCDIHMPKKEYDKMSEFEVKGLIVRSNHFTFEEVE